MMISIKKIFLTAFFLASSFFAQNVFAETLSFETGDAINITSNSATLQGAVHIESFQEFPVLWFQYGEDRENLIKKTFANTGIHGDYLDARSVYGLKSETIYYFRTILEIHREKQYGDIHSFKTKKENAIEGGQGNTASSQNLTDNALNAMLQDYDNYQKNRAENKTNSDSTVVFHDDKEKDGGSFSFFDFLNWFKKKKKTDDSVHKNENIVHSQEELDALKKQREKEKEARLKLLSEQKRYNNSAAEDDQRGEIVSYNPNYKNNYTKKSYVKSSSTSYYTKLFFIVLFLILILILARIFYLRQKRRSVHRLNKEIPRADAQHGKYYIPINNNLRNDSSREVPVTYNDTRIQKRPLAKKEGTTFFRRPPKK